MNNLQELMQIEVSLDRSDLVRRKKKWQSKLQHWPTDLLKRTWGFYIFSCLGIGFRFFLKSSHTIQFPAASCIFVVLTPCFGLNWIKKVLRIVKKSTLIPQCIEIPWILSCSWDSYKKLFDEMTSAKNLDENNPNSR